MSSIVSLNLFLSNKKTSTTSLNPFVVPHSIASNSIISNHNIAQSVASNPIIAINNSHKQELQKYIRSPDIVSAQKEIFTNDTMVFTENILHNPTITISKEMGSNATGNSYLFLPFEKNDTVSMGDGNTPMPLTNPFHPNATTNKSNIGLQKTVTDFPSTFQPTFDHVQTSANTAGFSCNQSAVNCIDCHSQLISTISNKSMIAPFYHGSFEFYGPYNRGLLVDSAGYPLISVNEWRDLLSLVNNPSLTEDVPKRLRFFRKLACLSFSLLLCGIGFLFFIPLWFTARSYERAFFAYALRVKLFLDTCSEGFSKRGLVFKLVRSSDPDEDADLGQDPYDICIAVSLATSVSKRSLVDCK